MTNPLSKELFIVLCCIVCGCISGVWYDFFKAARRCGMNSKAMVMVQDGCFWIGETLIIFLMLFYANDAKLRWYEFFFVIFGFFSYRCLLSEIMIAIWVALFQGTAKILKWLLIVLYFPLKKAKTVAKCHRRNKIIRFLRRILKRQH